MFSNVEKMIRDNPDLAESGQPQDNGAISIAEERLGLRFPDSFREYLNRWGWVSFGPNEYFGLGQEFKDIVIATERLRRICGLPRELVVVCDHDGDEYVCLDTSSFNNGECPVIVWDAPRRVISRPRATSFDAFLETDMSDFIE